MKHINENPYEFFQGSGWSFLGAEGGAESEVSEQDGSTSEFEAETDDFAESSSNDESVYSAADDGSDDSGSYDEDDSDDGALEYISNYMMAKTYIRQVMIGTSLSARLPKLMRSVLKSGRRVLMTRTMIVRRKRRLQPRQMANPRSAEGPSQHHRICDLCYLLSSRFFVRIYCIYIYLVVAKP
jgi:hypothetical protein